MSEPSLNLGNGDWAGKSGNLLAYHKVTNNFYADELTFSRASMGTIVNSDGLIEEVPYNLVTYSEDFTQWTNTRSSDEYGYDSPFSKNNASLLISDTTASSSHIIKSNTITVQSGEKYTYSVYVKANQLNFVRLVFTDATVSKFLSAYFNLETGVVGTTSNGSTATLDSATIENIGEGWYRCIVSGDLDTTTTAQLRVYLAEADNDSSFDGNGTSGIYIYGAQLNSGTSAKTYYPTTTRLNIPRVDYLNNTNGSLLLEPQRTNALAQSEAFDNAYWTKSGVAIIANDTSSPDGTTNADKIYPTSSGNYKHIRATSLNPSSGLYTFSIYAKKSELDHLVLIDYDGGGVGVDFDLTNGVATDNASSAFDSVEMIDFGNGWYRCIATATNMYFYWIVSDSGGLSVTASGTNGLYIWGAQAELGSYPTSYIPTSGTTVTRIQDTSSTTGLSSVINSTEGVLYAEIAALADDGTTRIISLSDGSDSNRIHLFYHSVSNQIALNYRVSGATQSSSSFNVDDITDFNKIAYKWKSGDFAMWVNGVEVDTDTNTTMLSTNTLNKLAFEIGSGGLNFFGNCQNLQIFKTALTDTELATLTTL